MSKDPDTSASCANSVAEFEELIGTRVMGDVPEVVWEDSHGCFQFATEHEARAALNDPYYQQFLPDVDWSATVVRPVLVCRHYCSDSLSLWLMIGKVSEKNGPLSLGRRAGRWWAYFGKNAKAEARTAPVAICLAALEAAGVKAGIDHDRIDAELSRLPGLAGSASEGPGDGPR